MSQYSASSEATARPTSQNPLGTERCAGGDGHDEGGNGEVGQAAGPSQGLDGFVDCSAQGLGYFVDLFKNRVSAYTANLVSKTKPKLVVVCMIYYLDVEGRGSWADATLSALGHSARRRVSRATSTSTPSTPSPRT